MAGTTRFYVSDTGVASVTSDAPQKVIGPDVAPGQTTVVGTQAPGTVVVSPAPTPAATPSPLAPKPAAAPAISALTPQQQLDQLALQKGWTINPMGGYRENLPGGGYKLYNVEPSGKIVEMQFTSSGAAVRAPTTFEIGGEYNPYLSAGGLHDPIAQIGRGPYTPESSPSGKGYYSPGYSPAAAKTSEPIISVSPVGRILSPSESLALGKAPVGSIVDVAAAVSSGAVPGYVLETPTSKEYFLTEKAAQAKAEEISKPLVSAPKPGEWGYHGTAERPGGIIEPIAVPRITPAETVFHPELGYQPITVPSGISGEPTTIKIDPKYGLMTNKDALALSGQKSQYESALGIVQAKEAEYSKGGFLPFTKEMTVFAEIATRPELLAPKINALYASVFGTPSEAKVAAQKETIARAQYYSTLPETPTPIDVMAGIATSLPVQAYATGAIFKAGTLAARMSLEGLGIGAQSIGLPVAPTAFRLASKAIEPATIIGGVAYSGAEIVSAPAAERPGKVGVMVAGLPAGYAGWSDVGKSYTKLLTIGMKEVAPPLIPEVISGKQTFPEIKPGTTPKELIESFQAPAGKLKGYHATESYKGSEATVIYPTTKTGAFAPGHIGDVPGLYISPEQYGTSPFFLRVGEYKGISLGGLLKSEPLSPTVMHIELAGVERLPPAARVRQAEAIEFLKPEGAAKAGQAYLTTSIERTMMGIGAKFEAEAVVTPGTVLKEIDSGTFFKYRGMNIPIREYVAGTEGQASVIAARLRVGEIPEDIGYRRLFVPSAGYPAMTYFDFASVMPTSSMGSLRPRMEIYPELTKPSYYLSPTVMYVPYRSEGYRYTTERGYAPPSYAPPSYEPTGYRPTKVYKPTQPYAPAAPIYAPAYPSEIPPQRYAPPTEVYKPTFDTYVPPEPSTRVYGEPYKPTGYVPAYIQPKIEYADTSTIAKFYGQNPADINLFGFTDIRYERKTGEIKGEEDIRKRKAKYRRKEEYFLGYRATPLIEPLAGIKGLFGVPKSKRKTRRTKRRK